MLGITAGIDKGVDYDNAECGALHGATFPNGLPKAGDDALPPKRRRVRRSDCCVATVYRNILGREVGGCVGGEETDKA